MRSYVSATLDAREWSSSISWFYLFINELVTMEVMASDIWHMYDFCFHLMYGVHNSLRYLILPSALEWIHGSISYCELNIIGCHPCPNQCLTCITFFGQCFVWRVAETTSGRIEAGIGEIWELHWVSKYVSSCFKLISKHWLINHFINESWCFCQYFMHLNGIKILSHYITTASSLWFP